MANVATTYTERSRGGGRRAADVCDRGFQEEIGAGQSDTLTSIGTLAITLKEQGRDEEAIRLIDEYFSSLTFVLISNHPFAPPQLRYKFSRKQEN